MKKFEDTRLYKVLYVLIGVPLSIVVILFYLIAGAVLTIADIITGKDE